MFQEGGQIDRDILYHHGFARSRIAFRNSSLRIPPRSLQSRPKLLPRKNGYTPSKRSNLIAGKFYLINAPWGFATVWSVIKRWLDPVTVDKISILGSSYQSTLLQQIPKENLPSIFGGDCRCQGGCELSDDGPWRDPQWNGEGAMAAKQDESSSTSASTEPIAPPTEPGVSHGETLPAA